MQVLQGAVCPEVKMGLDDAVSAIASVTEVAVTNDLAIAKVYISVYSDQTGRDIAMKALSRLEGYVSDSCSHRHCDISCTDEPATQCAHLPACCEGTPLPIPKEHLHVVYAYEYLGISVLPP